MININRKMEYGQKIYNVKEISDDKFKSASSLIRPKQFEYTSVKLAKLIAEKLNVDYTKVLDKIKRPVNGYAYLYCKINTEYNFSAFKKKLLNHAFKIIGEDKDTEVFNSILDQFMNDDEPLVFEDDDQYYDIVSLNLSIELCMTIWKERRVGFNNLNECSMHVLDCCCKVISNLYECNINELRANMNNIVRSHYLKENRRFNNGYHVYSLDEFIKLVLHYFDLRVTKHDVAIIKSSIIDLVLECNDTINAGKEFKF